MELLVSVAMANPIGFADSHKNKLFRASWRLPTFAGVCLHFNGLAQNCLIFHQIHTNKYVPFESNLNQTLPKQEPFESQQAAGPPDDNLRFFSKESSSSSSSRR